MRERILGGYDNFVLPFMIGMAFIFIYLLIGLARIFKHMPGEDRSRFFRSLVSPSIMLKNAKDIL